MSSAASPARPRHGALRWSAAPRVAPMQTLAMSGEVMNGDEERKVGEEEGKWGWERWKRHFALIEESERLVDELQVNFIPILTTW